MTMFVLSYFLHNEQELFKIQSCSHPSLQNEVIDCQGKGKIAANHFLLFETKLDINTISHWELGQIPKLSDKLALRIIQKRDELGQFQNYDQIAQIKGVGAKTLAKIRHYTEISENP